LLAFDPGVTTGYAMLTMHEEVIKTGTFDYGQIDDQLAKFQLLTKQYVVIEELVPAGINALNIVLSDIHATFGRAFPTALWVRPGLWKPMMNHERIKRLREAGASRRRGGHWERITVHEGDAVLMGIYAMRHRMSSLREIFEESA